MVFEELIITFELGISENLRIDYCCGYVQREYHYQQEFSQIGKFKTINLHDCFTIDIGAI